MYEIAMSWIVTYFIHSTFLLGLAWLMNRWLGVRRLAVRELLWKAALIGGLATATVQLATGWEPFAGSLHLLTPRASSEAVASAVAVEQSAGAPGPVREISPATVDSGAVDAPLTWMKALTWAWLLVAITLLVRLGIAYSLLHRRLSGRVQLREGPFYELFYFLAVAGGVERRAGLSASARIRVPLAIGLPKAEVCVPEAVYHAFDEEQQELVLAHEIAHLKRRDPTWLLLARVLESVLFFQPLNVIALRRLREIAELRCDDWSVEQTGRPLALARCLTRVAEWGMTRPESVAALSMAGDGSHLGARVRRLLGRGYISRDRGVPAWLSVALPLVMVVVVLTVPGVSQAIADEPPIADSAMSAPANPPGPSAAPAPPEAGASISGSRAAVPAPQPAAAPRPVAKPRPELASSPTVPALGPLAPSPIPGARPVDVPVAAPVPQPAAPRPVVASPSEVSTPDVPMIIETAVGEVAARADAAAWTDQSAELAVAAQALELAELEAAATEREVAARAAEIAAAHDRELAELELELQRGLRAAIQSADVDRIKETLAARAAEVSAEIARLSEERSAELAQEVSRREVVLRRQLADDEEVRRLAREMERTARALRPAQEELEALAARIEDRARELAESESTVRLEHEIAARAESLSRARSSELEKELARLHERLRGVVAGDPEIRRLTEEMERTTRDLHPEAEELRRLGEEMRREIERLRPELEARRRASEDVRVDLERARRELERELESLEDAHEDDH